MAEYEVQLGDNTQFTFVPYTPESRFAGKVYVVWKVQGQAQDRVIDYRDLREFARAAMDAVTDALVAGAVAEGKVPT